MSSLNLLNLHDKPLLSSLMRNIKSRHNYCKTSVTFIQDTNFKLKCCLFYFDYRHFINNSKKVVMYTSFCKCSG